MARRVSNRQAIAILAGSVVLAVGVGAGIRLFTSPQPLGFSDSEPTLGATAALGDDLDGGALFASGAFVPATQRLRSASPELLRSTPPADRLTTVVPSLGRPDPFTPLVTARPASASPQPMAAALVPAPPSFNATPLPVVPVAATQPLPPLPPVPFVPTAATQPEEMVPTFSLPASPVPMSPVDRIEITGVAQIGDRVSVIIREMGLSSSRYVREGDWVVGGQVRIKRIDVSSSEPAVILEFNGQEFYRTVGSGAVVGML